MEQPQWQTFCDAYGISPEDLTGLPTLLQMRELRSLSSYVRSDHPDAQAEANRRIADLMSGTQDRPWMALNLAR